MSLPPTKRPPRFRTLAFIAAVVLLSAVFVPNVLAGSSSSAELRVSKVAQRWDSVSLQGSTLSTNVAIFVSLSRRATVQFWLDDPLRQGPMLRQESASPFDLMGASAKGLANMLDTRTLGNGQHNVTAVVRTNGGQVVLSSPFTVANSPASSSSVTTTTAPSATTTTAPASTTTAAPTTTAAAAPTTTTTQASSTWPGPSNTGVPAGTALRVVYGDLNVSTAGQVVDAMDVRGVINVTAPNVTISRTKVQDGINSGSSNLMIVDTEIGPATGHGWGAGGSGIAVQYQNFTCLRCNVHSFSDGIRANGGVSVIDSWIHDLYLGVGDHNDAIQRYAPGFAANDLIRHNRIDCAGCTNAGIFYADNWLGTVTIDDNLLSGGGYTMKLHESGSAIVTNNRWVRDSYAYGPDLLTYGNILQWSGNVFDDNGAAVARVS